MQRVFHPALGLLHFRLSGAADAHDRHATGQLGQTLAELLAVVLALGLLHLLADLVDPLLDASLVGAVELGVDDGGVFLLHGHLFGGTQVLDLHVLELHAQIFADESAASQNGNITQDGLAAVAEARSLHRTHLEGAAKLVDHQGGEAIALHILGDDQEGPTGAGNLLQQGQQLAHVRQLLLVDQDQRLFQLAGHVGRGDEIRADVTLVKLHALDELESGLGGLALLDGDDPVLAHALKGIGHHVADFLVVVGANGSNLGNLFLAGKLLGQLLDILGDSGDSLVDTALHCHGVGARGDVAKAFLVDGKGQDSGSGGAVAGGVAGLLGDSIHQFGAHVLEGIGKVDLLAHGDAVLGDGRTAEALVDDHIAAGRPQGHTDSVGQFLSASQKLFAGILVIHQLLGHDLYPLCVCVSCVLFRFSRVLSAAPFGDDPPAVGLVQEILASRSLSRITFSSRPSTSTSLPA